MKFKKILPVVLVCLIALAGCKKDDKTSGKNFVKHDGTEYAIDKGYLENWGQWSTDGDNNIDLTLLSEGVTIVEVNNELDDLAGTGHRATFWMYSTGTTALNSQVYSYDDYATEQNGTFELGKLNVDYNFDSGSGLTYYVNNGTVTVEKDGATYKITIDCVDENGKKFTGSYEGTLGYYNWDFKKSTKRDKREF